MSKDVLDKLAILAQLRLSPAAAVTDALDLLEQAFPDSIGSMLIWGSADGKVAGGYSNLLGIEEGLAAYANTFANSETEQTITGSTFQSHLKKQTRSRRLEDAIQMPLADFRATDMCRQMLDPWGIRDLARCVVTADDAPLGGLVIFRGKDAPAFSDDELQTLDSGADLIGQLLRSEPASQTPLVDETDPGVAQLTPEGQLRAATRTFRTHLAMLNQAAPGQGPANFDFQIPPELHRAVGRLGDGAETVRVAGVWGEFRLTLERFIETTDLVLTSQRCIPAGLMMFRNIRDHALSSRQRQVACALAEGDSFHDMAKRWQITRNSIITHANFLYDKLGVSSKAELLNQFVWANP